MKHTLCGQCGSVFIQHPFIYWSVCPKCRNETSWERAGTWCKFKSKSKQVNNAKVNIKQSEVTGIVFTDKPC